HLTRSGEIRSFFFGFSESFLCAVASLLLHAPRGVLALLRLGGCGLGLRAAHSLPLPGVRPHPILHHGDIDRPTRDAEILARLRFVLEHRKNVFDAACVTWTALRR